MHDTQHGYCSISPGQFDFVMGMFFILFYSGLPSIIIIICNALIICFLMRASKKRSNMSGTTLCIKKSHINITIMLIVNSIVFIILTLPINIFIFINTYLVEIDRILSIYIGLPISLMNNANHAINFILYAVCGSQFRRELVAMVCCKPSKKATVISQSKSTSVSLKVVSEISSTIRDWSFKVLYFYHPFLYQWANIFYFMTLSR